MVAALIYSTETSGNARTLPLLPPLNTNTLATATYRTQSNLHVIMQDQQRSYRKLHFRELCKDLGLIQYPFSPGNYTPGLQSDVSHVPTSHPLFFVV